MCNQVFNKSRPKCIDGSGAGGYNKNGNKFRAEEYIRKKKGINTMNVAMISSWHVHAKGYAKELQKMPEVTITAVWDENPEAGQEWANELSCPFIGDYDALLADPSLDGVVIVSPTNMHGELITKAAKAGKHIFTEKVLAITNEEAEEIAQAVKASGKVFTISFPHCCNPNMQFTKQLLEKRELGQISYARVRNAHNGVSAEWLPDTFFDPVQCGGGAMMDLGAHPMYLLPWLLDAQPKSVISCYTQMSGKEVEDNAVSVFEYEGGAIAVSETSFMAQNNPFQLEICGTEGTLLIVDRELRYSDFETGSAWEVPETMSEPWPEPLEQWVGAVTQGKENYMGIDQGVALTKIMVGAYTSWKTGKKYEF